jgi:hypothetical protein
MVLYLTGVDSFPLWLAMTLNTIRVNVVSNGFVMLIEMAMLQHSKACQKTQA